MGLAARSRSTAFFAVTRSGSSAFKVDWLQRGDLVAGRGQPGLGRFDLVSMAGLSASVGCSDRIGGARTRRYPSLRLR
jgi:hypothetical protein